MLLNQAQAKAIYDAMCALNNIGARLNAMSVPCELAPLRVHERSNGEIIVYSEDVNEVYLGQAEFAAAYGV